MRLQLSLLLAPLALLLASADASAQRAGVSGKELMDECSNYPNASRPRTCELYASTFAELLRSNEETVNPRGRLCIGEDVTVDEIVAHINEWLGRNPNAGSRNGYDIAYEALEGPYRCK